MSHVKAFGLAVAFSWAVWITAETVSPFPPHVEKYENRDDAKTAVKQNGSADEPLALRLVEFIDTHNGLVASLATIAIAYFTWSLRQSTDKLWSSSKEQIEFSRNSFVVENRPYLTPVEFVINRIIDASSGRVSEYRFIPQWKNGGQTPAVKIVTVLSAKFFDKSGMPPDFDFPDNVQPIEGRTQGNMAGPGFPFFGPYADLQAVTLYEVMKQWRLYIWTWVEYSDVFPGTDRHRTEWCAELTLIGDPRDARPTPNAIFNLGVIDRFNGMDETCFRKAGTKARVETKLSPDDLSLVRTTISASIIIAQDGSQTIT